MGKETDIALESRIVGHLGSYPGIAAVYVFGSVATGRATALSDLDVAILFQRGSIPNMMQLLGLRERLSTLAGVEVDVVCLNTAPPVLAHQVLRHGKKIIMRDVSATNAFFVRTIAEYDDLKRIRRPVEQNVLRGRVHG
jgi:predicted nucleotidyltransferase